MSSYQQTKTSGPGMLATMAMLSLTLMGLGSNAITPALATLAAQFPNQDVSFTDGSHFEHDGRFADCRSGDGKEN